MMRAAPMRIMLLVASIALTACVSATGPDGRSRFCLYPGDTVGVISLHDQHRITTACMFIVQKDAECRGAIDSRQLFHASDCIVGRVDG